ncbi:MAG: peptidoglycan DD-metalloendopeptidase family protein [Cyanobacteria bacterium REEB67]|nr:peptidoglycan DD-metalloendopeptidase family protein [Cyanobacteria bacterium REEB67]
MLDAGKFVHAGEPIGLSGSTGWSSQPHLHFCVYTVNAKGAKTGIPEIFSTSNGPCVQPTVSDLLKRP